MSIFKADVKYWIALVSLTYKYQKTQASRGWESCECH